MKKIILAIDAYKGCLSSEEVEAAVEEGIRRVDATIEVCALPVADGGEGILEVLVRLTHGHKVEVETHDPLMRTIRAYYGVLGDGETAVVEMAQASGLPLLHSRERNPLLTTTYGTGEIVERVIADGYRKIIMGLGGSATNDAGMGMMQALGARFYNAENEELGRGCGKLLEEVAHLELADFLHKIEGVEFVTACDVDSSFCGPKGAAAVFAPQKGADSQMVNRLDQGMCHYATTLEKLGVKSMKNIAGAGAAGGMGGCLFAFFHSTLRPGIDLILDEIKFRQVVEGAVGIITGEGKSDRQTLLGKVPIGVLRIGQEMKVNVALLSGAVEEPDALLAAGFSFVKVVTPLDMPLDIAMQSAVAKRNIQSAVRDIVLHFLE